MNLAVLIPFLCARIFFSLASSILSVAIGWHLYVFTGDPFDLALVGLVQIVPILSLFIITGWVIDNFSRKWVLILCAVSEALIFLALAVLMKDMQPDNVNKLAIFGLLFLHGCSRAFYSPAQQAILPNIVSREALPKAVAVVSTAWNAASTSGPFIAGLLLVWLDLNTYWVLAALSSLGVVLLNFMPALKQVKPQNKNWRQVFKGVGFIKTNPYLLASLSLDLFAVLFGSVLVLLPIYVVDVLRLGPETLGALRGMPALGAVMVGLAITKLPPFKQAGKALFGALVVFGLSIVLFAFSKYYWLSLIALWFYGAADMVSVNIRSALMHLATPDELRGRVAAVNSLFIASSNRLGDFRAGAVAALLGPVTAVAIGGVMALGVAIGGYYLFPQIRQLSNLNEDSLVKSSGSP